ncbi:hypothetical protein ACIXNP_03085 [Bacteroides fragilis]
MGCAEGLALALLGNFQRYVVLRFGKFPNKLRYFLRKYPAACRPSARLPFGGGCPCRLLPRITPPYYFSLLVGGGRRGGRFRFQRLFCTGRRIQGFPDKYARSEARGRFIGKRRSRLTF